MNWVGSAVKQKCSKATKNFNTWGKTTILLKKIPITQTKMDFFGGRLLTKFNGKGVYSPQNDFARNVLLCFAIYVASVFFMYYNTESFNSTNLM